MAAAGKHGWFWRRERSMWQRLFAIFTVLACSGWSTSGHSAEPRLALVIGNSAYENNQPLNNPQNDAQAVAQLLNSAGFEVVMAFDLSRDIMRQTIEEFAARINEKGNESAALIYYAGHGMQVDGENYLVPVDAKLEKEQDLAENGIKLADVMGALQGSPSKIRIVILDACRNNPFSTSGVGGKGLAIVDAPAGTIVAYSTAPGTEAFDGTGKHSPFAAAFMRIAKQPDVPVEQVFKKVRRLVNDATDNKQTPWESSSLTADFVFFSSLVGTPDSSSSANVPGGASAPGGGNVPGGGGGAPSSGRSAVVPPGARVERVTVADLGSRPAIQAYDVVIEEDSVEYYEEFIRLYPADPLAAYARRKLALRQEMLEWQNVTYRNTPEAYATFASTFAGGAMFVAARKLQERPRSIEIALPRRGDPRLNTGNFGSFRVNPARSAAIINFPRSQNNPGQNINPNRNPVIPFQRNQGQVQNSNIKQANLPSNNNANQQPKSRLDQNRNTLQDRKNNAKQGRDADNRRGANNRNRENLRNARSNNREARSNRNARSNREVARSNRGNVRSNRESNFRSNRGNFQRQSAQRQNFQRQNVQRQSFQRQSFQRQSFGGGGGGFRGGGFRRSDIRLKHDIMPLGHLPNGLTIYSFRYYGDPQTYVGVMAQEAQHVIPAAVARGRDGYLRVRYEAVGFKFQTYEAWKASEESAAP